MTRQDKAASRRPRISIDIDDALRQQLRIAAAKRDVSMRRYILEALFERLANDVESDRRFFLDLTADPLLAELWDNPNDAAYDEL